MPAMLGLPLKPGVLLAVGIAVERPMVNEVVLGLLGLLRLLMISTAVCRPSQHHSRACFTRTYLVCPLHVSVVIRSDFRWYGCHGSIV